MMTPKLIRCVCFLVMTTVPMTLTLSGCAMVPSGDDANLSPAEQELRAQSANFDTTILQGAGIGALIGAAIGAVVSKNHLEGAIIGGGVGAAGGAAAGYGIAENNSAQANREATTTNEIDAARTSAQQFRQYARTAAAVAYQATTEASRLQARYASQQISAADYHSALQKYQRDNDALSTSINAAQKQASDLRAAAAQTPGYRGRQLNESADSIEASQSTMLQEQAQISQVLEETPEGSGS